MIAPLKAEISFNAFVFWLLMSFDQENIQGS